MNKNEMEHYLWVEKYRPNTLSDVILESDLKKHFEVYVKDQRIPHLLFHGSAGTAKTTCAKALCEDIGVEWLFVNASLEADIDLLRNKISGFCRSVSLSGDVKKVVLMDELDGVTSPAFFPAMRPMMELFSSNATFIGTCNYITKIPIPIQSRFNLIEFKITDRKWYAGEMLKRCEDILKKENVPFDKGIVAKIILKYFPDFRQVINALQQHQEFLTDPKLEFRLDGLDVSTLFAALKEGDFAKIREIIQNDYVNLDSVYTNIYRAIKDYIDPKDIPTAILVTSDFNRDHLQAVDKEVHIMAFLLTLKKNVKFI